MVRAAGSGESASATLEYGVAFGFSMGFVL